MPNYIDPPNTSWIEEDDRQERYYNTLNALPKPSPYTTVPSPYNTNVGLTSDDVTPTLKVGSFYAWLSPIALMEVVDVSAGVEVFTMKRWSPDPSVDGIGYGVMSNLPVRYLWFKDKFSLTGLEDAGPGAVYLDRFTNRLFFLGPDKGDVLADWVVTYEVLDRKRSMLFQAGRKIGWNTLNTRFDLIE